MWGSAQRLTQLEIDGSHFKYVNVSISLGPSYNYLRIFQDYSKNLIAYYKLYDVTKIAIIVFRKH